GSFYEDSKFAGSSAYFPSLSKAHQIEQYVPPDGRWGLRSSFRAEMLAAALAAVRAVRLGWDRLCIYQDCKDAIRKLDGVKAGDAPTEEILRDPILWLWWLTIQHIS